MSFSLFQRFLAVLCIILALAACKKKEKPEDTEISINESDNIEVVSDFYEINNNSEPIFFPDPHRLHRYGSHEYYYRYRFKKGNIIYIKNIAASSEQEGLSYLNLISLDWHSWRASSKNNGIGEYFTLTYGRKAKRSRFCAEKRAWSYGLLR